MTLCSCGNTCMNDRMRPAPLLQGMKSVKNSYNFKVDCKGFEVVDIVVETIQDFNHAFKS